MARPLSAEEFEAVKGLVEGRAEGMVDQEIHDNMDTALEFAWEMVYTEVFYSTPEELKAWAQNFDLDPSILEVSRHGIADGTKFTEYDKYLKSYREHIAPREANVGRLKKRLTSSPS